MNVPDATAAPERGEAGRRTADAAAEPFRRSLLFAALATAPLAVLLAIKVFAAPRPYWAFFFDPEVIFYFSGIDVLEGRPPSNTDHPGTTLEILTAAIAAFTGRSALDIDSFRPVAYWTAFALSFASVVSLRRTLLRGLGFVAAIACVWSFLLCPPALSRSTVWSPETVFLAFGGFALAMSDRCLRDPSSRSRAVAAGFAVGVCVALKFTFAVLAVGLACALVWSARRRAVRGLVPLAWAGGATAAGFFAATIPALSCYPRMFGFVSAQLSNSGIYGAGPAEAPHAREVTANVAAVVGTAGLWHAWLALCAVAAVWGYVRARRELRGDLVYGATMILGVAAAVLGYVAIVRNGNARYLLVSGVASIALVAAVARSFEAKAARAPGFALAAVAAALLAICIQRDVADHRGWIEVCTAQRDATLRRIAELRTGGPAPVVVYGRRSPDPAYALGVYVSTREQADEVHRRFPTTGWFNPWHPHIELPAGVADWDLLVIPDADVARVPFATGPAVARVGEFVVLARR